MGYSPSTGIWLCGTEESASGMVSGQTGTRCALKLLRGTAQMADLTVYVESDDGREIADLSLPLDRVSALLPDDLVSTTTLELRAGVTIKIPHVRHSIRVDNIDEATLTSLKRSAPKATRMEMATVTVLCNTNPKAGDDTSIGNVGPLGGKRRKPGGAPKSVVIHRWPDYRCGFRADYQLQLSPEPSQVALVEEVNWGCIDYGFDRRTAYPIDLADVCQDPPFEPRR